MACDRFLGLRPISPQVARWTSSSRLFASPEPLATEGPWSAYLDEETTGLVYYFNVRTGESRWVPPTKTFPAVILSAKLRNKAEEKQKAYREAVALQENTEKEEPTNFFTTLLAPDEEEKAQVNEPPKEEKKGEEWFAFLKDQPKEEKKVADEWFSWGKKEKKPAVADEWFSWFKPSVEETAENYLEEKARLEQDTSFLEANGAAVVEEPKVEPTKAKPTTKRETDTLKESIKGQIEPVKEKVSMFSRLISPTEQIETTIPAEKTIIVPEISAYVSPDPKKIFWGGEDAVFVKGRNFGVFDGVTGANKLDGRALYSKTMASEMKKNVGNEPMTIYDMYKLLGDAVKVANDRATGATTAMVASIGEDGFLRVLNVGDSTCIVIRNGKVAARSKEQNHFFECPYQFSEISPDKPRDGTKLNVELVPGDLVILGSDGVFDNLEESEIIEIAQSTPRNKVSTIAKRIVDRSRRVSFNPRAETPFARLAKRNNSPDYPDGVGGKVDDASCVVVRYG